MANIANLIRNSRFEIKTDANVSLTIESMLGNSISLKLQNVSLIGLGAVLDRALTESEENDMKALIPSAKIIIKEQEFFLGRLAAKRVSQKEGKTYLAFATIDMRVPIAGALSRYIDKTGNEEKSIYDFELSPEKFNVGSFEDLDLNSTDLFHRAEQFEIYYDEWIETAKYGHNNIRTPSQGERVKLKRTRKNKRNDFLVMGSNDYLGLAARPEVVTAAKKAMDLYGFGSTGSPLTTGITEIHEELNELLAKTFNQESAILFNSGYVTNIGTISGLTREGDLVLADFLAHASIQDGMRMSKANTRLFRHNDTVHLEKLLKEHRDAHAGAIIITEGVFSMDGDTPPIEDILKIAAKYNARVMLDEAHSFGVTGPHGLGCWAECPNQKTDIIMGTFSKICGGIGGFIAADKKVIKWLTWHARSHIFSVSIPPSTAAAALAAMKIFLSETSLHESLKTNIKHFVSGIRELGCPINAQHESAVIPVIVGDEKKLGIMHDVLREGGIYVIPVIYPAVSKKNCRFRFTVMATHTVTDIDYALSTLEKAMKKADFQFSEPQ